MPEPYVLAVTGSRHHTNRRLIREALTEAIHAAPAGADIEVRHGDCPTGADALVAHLLRQHRAFGNVFNRPAMERAIPADWDHCTPDCPNEPHRVTKLRGDRHHPGQLDDYCPGAGPRRNALLVDGAHLLLAFPLGLSYGTRNCMKQARNAGVPVHPITRKAHP